MKYTSEMSIIIHRLLGVSLCRNIRLPEVALCRNIRLPGVALCRNIRLPEVPLCRNGRTENVCHAEDNGRSGKGGRW